jgi:hypothetical protein
LELSRMGLPVCETGGDDMLIRKDGVHEVMTRLTMA